MSDGSDTGKGRNDSGTGDGATPTINKYVAKLRRLVPIGQGGRQFAFRGHADSRWKLESTARRRHDSETPWGELIEYNCNLVADAKNANYHQKENNSLADIEMLAELRHHSAATALIDFTRDFHVALWFACEPVKGDSQEDKIFVVETGKFACKPTKENSPEGKIFVVDTDNAEKFSQLTSEDKKKDLKTILGFQQSDGQNDVAGADKRRKTPPGLWYWEPRFEINHRLSSQKGVFIFGKDDIPCQEIKIQGKDKKAIREELSTWFGINEKSLFNDLPGFATLNDVNHKITWADYFRAGISYHQKGELEKAIEQYDKTIGRNRGCADAYNNRGVAKLLLGRPEAALPDFSRAIKLDPKDATAYNNRGNAKKLLGRLKEALRDFSRAIKLAPQDATAYKNRGITKIDLKLLKAAIRDLTQAIKLAPQDATAYKNRGIAKMHLKRLKAAIRDLTQAIKLAPQDAMAYYFRAPVHTTLGNTTAARADLNKALDLATDQDNKELAKLIQDALETLKQLPSTT